MFLERIPEETKKDFQKPENNNQPLWAIPDSKGTMKGLLHTIRSSEYCQDVIIFVTEKTRQDYLEYLKERNYDYHITGKDKVDLKKMLKTLKEKYGTKIVRSDSGPTLNGLLLDLGLVSEISLLISPVIIGEKGLKMFSKTRKNLKLEMKSVEKFGEDLHVVYTTEKFNSQAAQE
jgi:2,5-diamino-6-(ribosylamino)-4(3H)-pyrimidinone 5'-phosphate reductase